VQRREYKVVKGDTLARIARKLYGDGKRWPDIATANNLADPGRIRPGQILLIP
jgi:nucleoid-associated protein YgaU